MDAVPVISNLSVELAVVRVRRAGSSALRLRALAIKPASPKHVNGFIHPNAHRLEQGQITVSLLSQTTIVDVTFDQIAVISVRMDAVPVISNLSVELAVVRVRRAGSSALRLRALAIKPASPKHVNGFIHPNAHRLEQGQITISRFGVRPTNARHQHHSQCTTEFLQSRFPNFRFCIVVG